MSEKIEIIIAGHDRFSGTFRKVDDQLDRTGNRAKNLGLAVVALNQGWELLNRTLGVVSGLAETADKYRRLDILLTRVEGSSEGAATQFTRLKNLARESPLTLDALTDSYVKLRTVGLADSERTVRALSDAVAAFGGSEQEFRRASIALQQMAGKGVISMEELRQQLGEAIPTAMQIMAREMGMSTAEFVKEVSRGNVAAKDGIEALTRGMEKDFSGASKAMMNTWAGATSNLQDSWEQFVDVVANSEGGVSNALIQIVQDLSAGLNRLTMFTAGLREARRELEMFSNSYDPLRAALEAEQRNVAMARTGAEGGADPFSGLGGAVTPAPASRRAPSPGDSKQAIARARAFAEEMAAADMAAWEKLQQIDQREREIRIARARWEGEQLAAANMAAWEEIERIDAREHDRKMEQAIERAEQMAEQDMLAQEMLNEIDQRNRELDVELQENSFEQAMAREEQHFQGRLRLARHSSVLLEREREAHKQRMEAIETAQVNSLLAIAGTGFQNLAQAARVFGEQQGDVWKGFAIAQATISTYLAANQIFAAISKAGTLLGPAAVPLAYAGMATAIASGLANVYQIAHAHAGLDFVPREQTFMLQRGERVIAPEQNRDLTAFLQSQTTGGSLNINVQGDLGQGAVDRLVTKLQRERDLGYASL